MRDRKFKFRAWSKEPRRLSAGRMSAIQYCLEPLARAWEREEEAEWYRSNERLPLHSDWTDPRAKAMQAWANKRYRQFVPVGPEDWYPDVHPAQRPWDYEGRPDGLIFLRGAREVRRKIWGGSNAAAMAVASRYFRRIKHTCPHDPDTIAHLDCIAEITARLLAKKGFEDLQWWTVQKRRQDDVWIDGVEVSRLWIGMVSVRDLIAKACATVRPPAPIPLGRRLKRPPTPREKSKIAFTALNDLGFFSNPQRTDNR